MSKVIVVFEGKEITNLSMVGAKAFVKQNKGAYIKGVETVEPIPQKKKEVAAVIEFEEVPTENKTEEVHAIAKRTRTRKENLDNQ